MTISNIPVAISSAMAAAIIPTIVYALICNDRKKLNTNIHIAIKYTMIVTIPCAVGMFFLSGPIIELLFSNTESEGILAKNLLMILAISVIFYSVSTLTSSMLQALGKIHAPVIHACIALLVQTAFVIVMLLSSRFDIYLVAVSNCIYAFIMAALNHRLIRREVNYHSNPGKEYGIPFITSLFMGISCRILYPVLLGILKLKSVTTLVIIFIAVILYFFGLLMLKEISIEEIRYYFLKKM